MARDKGIQDDETQAVEQAADEVGVPLPDIKQALQRKAIEKEMEKIEEEEEANRVKIKRTDKEAFAKVRQKKRKSPSDDYFNYLRRSMKLHSETHTACSLLAMTSNQPLSLSSYSFWSNSHMPMLIQRFLKKKNTQALVPYWENELNHFWEFRLGHCRLDTLLVRW